MYHVRNLFIIMTLAVLSTTAVLAATGSLTFKAVEQAGLKGVGFVQMRQDMGQALATARQPGETYELALIDPNKRAILSRIKTEATNAQAVVADQDLKQALLVEGDARVLWAVDLTSGQSRRIYTRHRGVPAFAPYGTFSGTFSGPNTVRSLGRFVSADGVDHGLHLVEIHLDRPEAEVLAQVEDEWTTPADAGDLDSVTFTPGPWVLFRFKTSTVQKLYAYNYDTKSLTLVDQCDKILGPALAVNGRAAYIKVKGHVATLVVRNLGDPASAKEVATGVFLPPALSPDGRYLVVGKVEGARDRLLAATTDKDLQLKPVEGLPSGPYRVYDTGNILVRTKDGLYFASML